MKNANNTCENANDEVSCTYGRCAMGRYNEASKNYSITYERENLKRIPFNVQKEYYESILKPAAEAAGEPMNTYIKKAIEMRMKADGLLPKPKAWFLIEDCMTSKAEVFHTELKATEQKDAIAEAVAIWSSLSAHDQQQREACYICKAACDEYGDPDLDTATDFINIKKAPQS